MKIGIIGSGPRLDKIIPIVKKNHEVTLLVSSNKPVNVSQLDTKIYSIESFENDKLPNQIWATLDLLILCSYGKKIAAKIYTLPRLGAINLHASPIPFYRGGSPLNWMIINGEKKGGVSILVVDDGIDTGPVVAQSIFEINGLNYQALSSKANHEFARLLEEILADIENVIKSAKPQNHFEGTHYTTRTPTDGKISFKAMHDQEIERLTRALMPPVKRPFFIFEDKEIELVEVSLCKKEYKGPPGRVAGNFDSGVVVICKNRGICLKKISLEGTIKSPVGIIKHGFTLP